MLRRVPPLVILVGLVTLSGCTTVVEGRASAPTASQAAVDAPWAHEATDIVATGEPPQFPVTLDHWSLQNAWTARPRAFEGVEWTPAEGADFEPFPAAENGCEQQRFLVRWRVVVEGIDVEAAGVDAVGGDTGTTAGHEGWMDLDGCLTPSFRMAADDQEETTALVDLAVEIQQYWPAV